MSAPNVPSTLPDDALDDALPTFEFTPVVRLRQRRGGWDADRQRGFIAALAHYGSVAAAARSVGMTPHSAYRLCNAAGADEFVRAWDQAIDCGRTRLRLDSLKRAFEGDYVPVYRRGKLVRVEHRRNDRLAIALLTQRAHNADDLRYSALRRRRNRLDLDALDQARAERERVLAAAEAAFRAEVDRLLEPPCERDGLSGPRVTRL